VQLSLVSDEFDLPVGITFNPFRPEEIIVVERDGLAKSLSKKDGSTREVLDIEDLINETHQHGLMSLAYSNKMDSGTVEFFANYIDIQGDLVVARFADNGGKLVDDQQMSVILKIAQIGPNSHGSQLHTLLDNSLMVTTGDGEENPKIPSHAAQSSRSLLGKVLRISPHNGGKYTVPNDNPFARDNTSLPEVWALGFRNPSHISIDSSTGDVFVIDANTQQLEINLVQSGKNYGWDVMEGSTCRAKGCSPSSYTLPIIEIPRSAKTMQVVGGAVYRGKQLPNLTGQFIFADSASSTIFAAESSSDKSWRYSPVATLPKKQITAIGQDAKGELFVATRDGAIFEIRPPQQ
jgi:glucose/arabinose dehydrogenase